MRDGGCTDVQSPTFQLSRWLRRCFRHSMGIPRDCKSLRSGGSITTGLASGSRIPLDAPNGASVSYSPLAKLSASSHPVQRSQTNAEDQHEALHLKLKHNRSTETPE